MNEKFFDLKKEKQDRMINAAIRIFALNGYRHSSTDDIVVAAQISKGLLFHYFGSKIGLYEFVYDYCVRFLSFELKSAISDTETDYFNIMRASEAAKKSVLKTYPYLQMFIDRSKYEEDENALFATADQRDELQRIYDGFLNQVDSSKFKKEVDPASINTMLQSTVSNIMNEQLLGSGLNADKYYKEVIKYINMLENICY